MKILAPTQLNRGKAMLTRGISGMGEKQSPVCRDAVMLVDSYSMHKIHILDKFGDNH